MAPRDRPGLQGADAGPKIKGTRTIGGVDEDSDSAGAARADAEREI